MKLIVSLALLTTHALACSVPVFRYGLEHWAPDAYQILVFKAGPLSADERALVQKLGPESHTNASTQIVDLNTATTEQKKIWSEGGQASVVVMPPAASPTKHPVWTAATLTAESVAVIQDSPMRKDIAQRLAEGDSAIWLLLDSGDKASDDATAKTLEGYLTRAAETMELPKLDDQDIKNGLVSVPDEGLRLTFPLVRLRRDDPAEQFLVHCLLATELDLKDLKAPMVFPIFGRGRVLYSLVGRGITMENVTHAASFLLGSCSCQIKEQNPGVDLLMSADWKTLLKVDVLADDVLPTAEEILNRKPVLVPIPERVAPSPTTPSATIPVEPQAGTSGFRFITLAALGLFVFGILWRLLKRRS